LFVSDVVEAADLSGVIASYAGSVGDRRGYAPYHPVMMVKLLVYGYCTGKVSSRKIEAATHGDIAFRVLAGDQHPDHSIISEFRRRHLKQLRGLFLEVLQLCEKAGLVSLGHVAIDGSKILANASKHKAMSYDRMVQTEERLKKEVETLLEAAEKADQSEDEIHGKGKRGDDLPAELARRNTRLKKIAEAKGALQAEAEERAREAVKESEVKMELRAKREAETGRKTPGPQPKPAPDPTLVEPEPKAQRNFTDPDSRIMLDGATKAFVQAYNAQIAVDSDHQIIVAAAVTQEANDKNQLIPMLEKVKENTGKLPEATSADAGYFSEANVNSSFLEGTDLYVPPDRQKHGPSQTLVGKQAPDAESTADKMRSKLNTETGQEIYGKRKQIVEPVFGQTKEVRSFRRFSFRGLAKVCDEWIFVCMTHNLLKLFRAGGLLVRA
jgi:transposase